MDIAFLLIGVLMVGLFLCKWMRDTTAVLQLLGKRLSLVEQAIIDIGPRLAALDGREAEILMPPPRYTVGDWVIIDLDAVPPPGDIPPSLPIANSKGRHSGAGWIENVRFDTASTSYFYEVSHPAAGPRAWYAEYELLLKTPRPTQA